MQFQCTADECDTFAYARQSEPEHLRECDLHIGDADAAMYSRARIFFRARNGQRRSGIVG